MGTAIATIRANSRAALEEISNKKEAETCLNYIDFLASTNGISADKMELPDFSFSKDGSMVTWPYTKKDMTKIFFDFLETAAKDKKEGMTKDEAFAAFVNKNKSKAVENVTKLIKERERRMNDFVRGLHDDQAFILRQISEIAQIEKGSVEPFIADIAENTFFTYEGYGVPKVDRTKYMCPSLNEKALMFSTPEIPMTFKDNGAGIDVTLNMGSFMLAITDSFAIWVFPHMNNITGGAAANFYHPHVHSEGRICWGDQSAPRDQAVKTCSIVPILKIVQAILTTYNQSSPYVPLTSFDHRYKEIRDKIIKGVSATTIGEAAEFTDSGAGFIEDDGTLVF